MREVQRRLEVKRQDPNVRDVWKTAILELCGDEQGHGHHQNRIRPTRERFCISHWTCRLAAMMMCALKHEACLDRRNSGVDPNRPCSQCSGSRSK